MLQDGGLSPALGASADLPAIEQHVAQGSAREAQEGLFSGWPHDRFVAEHCCYLPLRQRFDERLVEQVVQKLNVGAPGMPWRNDNAVRQFAIVQDGPATTQPARDGARSAGGMLLAIGVRLKVTQAECRWRPTIESQQQGRIVRRTELQRFIDRHVPRARRRWIKNQAAAGCCAGQRCEVGVQALACLRL